MKKSVLLGILFIAVVIGALVFTTMSSSASRYRVEVCVNFRVVAPAAQPEPPLSRALYAQLKKTPARRLLPA